MSHPAFDESKIVIWVGDNGYMTPQCVGGNYSPDFPPRWTIAHRYDCDGCSQPYESWATDAEHWLKLPSFLWKNGVFLCVDCFRLLVQAQDPADDEPREKMMAYIRDNRQEIVAVARQIFDNNLSKYKQHNKPKRH